MAQLKLVFLWLLILGLAATHGKSVSELPKPQGDVLKDDKQQSSEESEDSIELDESFGFGHDSSADSMNEDLEEVDLYGPPYSKKWVGHVFGGGFDYKRRDPYIDKGLALARFYNLDDTIDSPRKMKQLKTHMTHEHEDRKANLNVKDMSNNKAGVEEEQSNSDSLDLDSRELDEHKRLFGYRLGHGFALGKRFKRSLKDNREPEEEYPGEGPEYYPDENDSGEKRYFASDMGGRFGRRSYDSDEVFYPYGDREDDMNDYYRDKRYFHTDLGHRFGFGKRSNWKRYFGHVLGNGFRLGKRGNQEEMMPYINDNMNEEELAAMYFRYPIGMVHGEREPYGPPFYQDGPQLDKRFGHILGHGFRFGKRRYGWVLGNGFALGKRHAPELYDSVQRMYQALEEDEDIEKRFGLNRDPHSIKRFGLLLGHGMHLGKRQDGFNPEDSLYSDYYDAPYKREHPYIHYKRRPFGHVLGNGFAFGKRSPVDRYTSYEDSDSEEMPDWEKRAFGHWLGHGFKLGKRSREYPDDEYDKKTH